MRNLRRRHKKVTPSFDVILQQLENFRTYILTQPLFLTVTRWQKPPFVKRYFVTFIIVLFISLIRILLNSTLEQNISYIIFTFAVVISAWYGGLGTGIFATFLCIVSGMYFSVEPGSALSLHNREEQLRVTLFIIQGSFISLLSESVQDATRWQSIILESISDVFITYDRNMRFMYLNQKAEEMLGTPRRKLLGQKLTTLYPDAKKTIVYKHIQEVFKTQKSKQFEMHISNEKKWFDVSLYPSNDGVSVYYQDITKRKVIEKKLRESQLQFKRFVDSNVIGVVVEGLNGIIYEANDVYLNMIGYTRNDFVKGKVNWKEITPPEYRSVDERMNAVFLKKGLVKPYIKEYIRKDSKRIYVLVGGVLLNRTTQKVMTFYLDITEQKELEKKKNEFISIASHELKTPLTSAKAFTQILIKHMNKTGDTRSVHYLMNVNNQIDKLNNLVSDLLDVSKIEEGRLLFRKTEFSVESLIKKVVNDFHYIAPTHRINREGESSHIILGDEDRIGQVLINLLSNAIKYSPKSDNVILSIQDNLTDVRISVKDFGVGIPTKDVKRIFDRFYRSDKHETSKISGFGLGLYISKEIIEKHKGKIYVESKEGEGSTFTIQLPVYKKDSVANEDEEIKRK